MRQLVLQEVSVSEATSGIDFYSDLILPFRTQTRYRIQTRVLVVPVRNIFYIDG